MSDIVPLRKCRKCPVEALTPLDLTKFIKHPKGLYGYANLCKQCDVKRDKAKPPRHRKQKEYNYNIARAYKLKKKYGISVADYDKMYEEQEGKCLICHTSHLVLSIDHNHETGNVRALLCNHCNTALGLTKESVLILENLIQYINKYN